MNLGKKLTILFIAEIMLICFFVLTGYQSYRIDPEGFRSNFMELSDNRFVMKDEIQAVNDKYTILYIDYGHLSPGTYKGSVSYSGKNGYEQYLRFDCSNNDYIEANNILLDQSLDSESFIITVTHPVENFTVLLDFQGGDDFSIDFRLNRSKIGMIRNCAAVVMIFSILELSFVLFRKNPEKKKTTLLLLGFSLFAFLPYLLMGVYPGHDFEYHLLRMESILHAIQDGQFPVYINPLFIGNYGYPASLYYCDLFLMFPVFFRLLGFSVNISYKLFVLIINIITVYIAYKSFKEIFKKQEIALLLSFVYVCAPYRLMDIYVRSAVGEFCAFSFLPMVCAGFYGICNTKKPIRANEKYILYLSIGMSGIFLSHMLTTEMTVTALLILAIVMLKKILTGYRIRAIIFSVVHCVFLCLFFLVPFIDFYSNNDIEIKHGIENGIPSIQIQGVQFGELFMFFKDIFGAGGTDYVLGDRFYLSIGLVLIFSVVFSLVSIFKKNSSAELKIYTGMTCLCLFLASNLFPWNTIAYYSKIGVILSQIQFPWRFLTLGTVFSVLALGELLASNSFVEKACQNKSKNSNINHFVGLIFIGFVVFSESTIMFSNYSSNAMRVKLYNTYDINVGKVRPFHVTRYGSDPKIFTGEIITEGAIVNVLKKNGFKWDLHCESESDGGVVTMPLINYKGYEVFDEYGGKYNITDGPNKEIRFTLPKNFKGNISIYYQPEWYWYMSACISLFYALLLLIKSTVLPKLAFKIKTNKL